VLLDELERRLDSFDAGERRKALTALREMVETGATPLPKAGTDVNLHAHTFFSFNSYGYSPSKLAWLFRKEGLAAGGVVDFDVLDALEEFLESAKMLGLKAAAGFETRVFVPEFAARVINSPGEPGISYHVGAGLPTANLKGDLLHFLAKMRQTAQQRNRDLMERVNKYLEPVVLDYEKDVLILTPSGNATERHICLAYARKAGKRFGKVEDLAHFWTEKLDAEAASAGLPESRELLDTIRAKTMKRGGVGYVQPDGKSFPLMSETNDFILKAGGIPTLAWLNGLSEAEQAIDELLDVAMGSGTAAVTLMPDRNYKPGVKDEKLENLYAFIELVEDRGLPIFAGTEMNSPGQKFVDAFASDELSPLVPVFLKGANILFGHSALQRQAGLGYCSQWAKKTFDQVADKNDFFEALGNFLHPKAENILADANENSTPEEILALIST